MVTNNKLPSVIIYFTKCLTKYHSFIHISSACVPNSVLRCRKSKQQSACIHYLFNPAWPAHYPIRWKKCRPNSQTHFRLTVYFSAFGFTLRVPSRYFRLLIRGTVLRGEFVYVLHTFAYTGKMVDLQRCRDRLVLKFKWNRVCCLFFS